MIRRKKKTCVTCGQQNYIFSKGRCKSCAQVDYARKSAPNKITKSKSQSNQRLRSVYSKIDKVRGRRCESCGSTNKPLSHSHTISRGRCQRIGKPHLIEDENNIVIECFGDSTCCHDIWEHGTLSQQRKLLTFESKVAYIKEHDPELYQRRFAEN